MASTAPKACRSLAIVLFQRRRRGQCHLGEPSVERLVVAQSLEQTLEEMRMRVHEAWDDELPTAIDALDDPASADMPAATASTASLFATDAIRPSTTSTAPSSNTRRAGSMVTTVPP
jgi:hypothetical protein